MAKKFNEILRSLMRKKNITLEMLAQHIGYKKQAISNYLCGLSKPNYENLKKIADYLGVTCDYLLTGVEPQDEKEHKDLRLSGDVIRYLKNSEDDEVKLINDLLCDETFRTALSLGIERIKRGDTEINSEGIIEEIKFGLINVAFPELKKLRRAVDANCVANFFEKKKRPLKTLLDSD